MVPGRLAATQCKNGKPAVVLGKDYTLWLFNMTDSEMEVTAGELAGFGPGTFENLLVRSFVCIICVGCSFCGLGLKSGCPIVVVDVVGRLLLLCVVFGGFFLFSLWTGVFSFQ